MLLMVRRLKLKWMRIGPRIDDKLLSLPTDYAESLGAQIGLSLDDIVGDGDCHVCGVVEYKFQERPTFLLPFCGMVNFVVHE